MGAPSFLNSPSSPNLNCALSQSNSNAPAVPTLQRDGFILGIYPSTLLQLSFSPPQLSTSPFISTAINPAGRGIFLSFVKSIFGAPQLRLQLLVVQTLLHLCIQLYLHLSKVPLGHLCGSYLVVQTLISICFSTSPSWVRSTVSNDVVTRFRSLFRASR